jgi:hypothetical protein
VSEVQTLKCDECGKLRVNDSNHWLEARAYGAVVAVGTVGSLEKDKVVHLCGQECAMKWVGVKIGEL